MQYTPPRSKDYNIKPLCYLFRFLFTLFTLIGCTSRKIAGLQHYIIIYLKIYYYDRNNFHRQHRLSEASCTGW
jgi:hypothetical protein